MATAAELEEVELEEPSASSQWTRHTRIPRGGCRSVAVKSPGCMHLPLLSRSLCLARSGRLASNIHRAEKVPAPSQSGS
eukprot:4469764-Prymnesium_polylepis.1